MNKNNIILFILIILIIVIILLLNKYFKNNNISSNAERHLYDNNIIGHYSKITKNNIFMYPKYIFSHPQKYTLYAGDCLIIPKNWWHWVFSYENTFSINYWHNLNLFKNPEKRENFINKVDIKNNEKIKKYLLNFNIINGNTNETVNINMSNFLNNNDDNMYFVTLDEYTYNDYIKLFLNDKIEHPKLIKDNNINNYNFWYCPKKMDSGLHYDDYEGILCVLSGKKTVYLYPPSDTKYLYPYDLKPEWYHNKFEDMEYNIYKLNSTELLDKIPSNRILYKLLNNRKKDTCRIVDKLHNYSKKTNNTIIYGIKNDMNKIWYEYYFFNIDKYRNTNKYFENFNIIDTIKELREIPLLTSLHDINLYVLAEFIKNKNLTIFSFEVHDLLIEGIDLHINNNDLINLPYYGETYNINKDIITKKNIFIVDYLTHFINNIDHYCNYFNITNIKKLIINEIDKYNYVEHIAFYKKSETSISIMWLGLNNNDFIKFLEIYKWPNYLIDYYKNNDMSHIKNEINIIYDIIDENKLKIVRTNIYGSI